MVIGALEDQQRRANPIRVSRRRDLVEERAHGRVALVAELGALRVGRVAVLAGNHSIRERSGR
jgi:hypothetical protein